jgi:hypothetical protein
MNDGPVEWISDDAKGHPRGAARPVVRLAPIGMGVLEVRWPGW